MKRKLKEMEEEAAKLRELQVGQRAVVELICQLQVVETV